MIIGAASFNESKCEGNLDTSKEFKNSMGKCTAYDSSGTESSDLYSTGSPGNCATKGVLIVRVVSLSGAKMHRSESPAIFLKLIREQIWIHFGYQFVYTACNGSYIFRQLNYIRASVYRIVIISNG